MQFDGYGENQNRVAVFFRGASLRPVPPGKSKHAEVRYVDIYEDDLDEGQIAAWVKQAAALPGWVPSQDRRQGRQIRHRRARQGRISAGDSS